MNATRIVIFAKALRPGAVKTRLIRALGAAGAAALARRMLEETLASALAAKIGPVELCMAPGPGTLPWREVSLPPGIQTSDQGKGDLGQRLARAAQRTLARGEALLLIGTDCAELSPDRLHAAARALGEVGAVIHPTADGGYALLGLTRFDPTLFDAIPWSSAAVAATTLRRFAALEWPVHVARTLHDVDRPEDLKHLPPAWLPSTPVHPPDEAGAWR